MGGELSICCFGLLANSFLFARFCDGGVNYLFYGAGLQLLPLLANQPCLLWGWAELQSTSICTFSLGNLKWALENK